MTATGTAPAQLDQPVEPVGKGGAHRAASSGNRARTLLRHAANPTLLLGVVAPFAVYELLHGRTSDVTALAVGAAFPAAATLWTLVRTRRPDPISLMTLAGIVLGLVGALLFDSPLFLLLKESVVTGTIGLVFLGSLLAARPLTFVMGRSMMATTDAERSAYDATWELAPVQAGHRRITLQWGAALVTDAAVRTVLAFVLTPGTLLAVSPLIAAVVIGPVAIMTLARRRRAAARMAAAAPRA